MFKKGNEVMVATWVDSKRASPLGRVIAERSIRGRPAYAVQHACGKVRTWYGSDLVNVMPGQSARV